MNEAEALAELERRLDWEADPALSVGEMSSLVDRAKIPDGAGNLPVNVVGADTWATATAHQIGDVVTADPAAGRWWRCVTPGTTGATQPIWPDLDGTRPYGVSVHDGTVTWVDVGSLWKPTWDLDYAAAEGWRLKAGKVAGRYDFITDGQTFRRGQILDHCRSMERAFRRRIGRL